MMFELISELAGKCAASGCEQEIRECIAKKLSAFDIEFDAHGSLIAHKKGKSPSVAIVAGMDVPALFTTHTANDGFARFCTMGVDHKKLFGIPVRLCDGREGSVWREKDKDEMTDMFIDFGEDTVKEAQPVMIDIKPYKKGNYISGFAVGNYAAMAAVISAALAKTGKDIYFVFLSRTQLKKFSVGFMKDLPHDTEYICVEKSAANDIPGEKNTFNKLDGGVCLRIMDKSLISSKSMVSKALSFADNIKVTKEVSKRDGLGGVLQTSYGGANVLSLGIPVRYCDEICETVSINDIKNMADMLIKFSEV